jgi:hypothetical protein
MQRPRPRPSGGRCCWSCREKPAEAAAQYILGRPRALLSDYLESTAAGPWATTAAPRCP